MNGDGGVVWCVVYCVVRTLCAPDHILSSHPTFVILPKYRNVLMRCVPSGRLSCVMRALCYTAATAAAVHWTFFRIHTLLSIDWCKLMRLFRTLVQHLSCLSSTWMVTTTTKTTNLDRENIQEEKRQQNRIFGFVEMWCHNGDYDRPRTATNQTGKEFSTKLRHDLWWWWLLRTFALARFEQKYPNIFLPSLLSSVTSVISVPDFDRISLIQFCLFHTLIFRWNFWFCFLNWFSFS